MSKEHLLVRLSEIDKAMNQCVANYNMLQGGKEEVNIMLKQLELVSAVDEVVAEEVVLECA